MKYTLYTAPRQEMKEISRPGKYKWFVSSKKLGEDGRIVVERVRFMRHNAIEDIGTAGMPSWNRLETVEKHREKL